MSVLDAMAERHILEAQARGEFEDLPGAGAPLDLEDDALVPEELRVAYRMLRNAGFLPPEFEPHAALREAEQLLIGADDALGRARLVSKISFIVSRGAAGHRRGDLRVEQAYFERLSERLERR